MLKDAYESLSEAAREVFNFQIFTMEKGRENVEKAVVIQFPERPVAPMSQTDLPDNHVAEVIPLERKRQAAAVIEKVQAAEDTEAARANIEALFAEAEQAKAKERRIA